MMDSTGRRLGVAFVGLGGAVASTAVAGIELIKQGHSDATGLPLAERDPAATGLAPYEQIVFAGWDICPDDVAAAARGHKVLRPEQLEAIAPTLANLKPWAGGSDANFCRNIDGGNVMAGNTKMAQARAAMEDIRAFKDREGIDDVVVINLASTEKVADLGAPVLRTIEAFEHGLEASDPAISPAMIYAYAAIKTDTAYGNFTPSAGAEAPALTELAKKTGVPVAGRDGKTGQTLLKTVLAPALRARALKVTGWYSTNILGNRDGQALEDPESLASKLDTKGDVLDSMLGYRVKDHIVSINYYPPRGDDKEAWDNIDVVGFLGQPMQIKVNFLCRDSVLAAPLAIEIARCLDLAKRRGQGGPIDALGMFFKAPMTADGSPPVHAFDEQARRFDAWLTGKDEHAGDGGRQDVPVSHAPAFVPAK